MALPDNLSYTQVKGRFVRSIIDSMDPDRLPDSKAIAGLSVTITPTLNPPRVKNINSEPATTIYIDPITCETNDNGDLISPDGSVGVYILASDDPDLDPSGWTYTVKISAPSHPEVIMSFVAPSNGTVDLTTLVPVPESPGTNLDEWLAAVQTTQSNVALAQQARADAQTLSDALPHLDAEGVLPDEILPLRLSEENLINLIQLYTGEGGALVAIDGGGPESFASLDLDGGAPNTTSFDNTLDGGQSTDTAFNDRIDGGTL